MGRLFLMYLDGRIFRCRFCLAHLANSDDLVSTSFHCRHGKAYLFNSVVNVSLGAEEDRMMTTGMHTVADLCCNCCNQIIGWKYEAAHDNSQKYKEGKYVLECAKIVDGDGRDFCLDTNHLGSDLEDG